jgi:hypothetical protein
MDISNFNNAAKAMVAAHMEKINVHEKCGLCDILFTGRSIRQSCSICSEKYHKNCFSDANHLCLGAGTSDSITQQTRQTPEVLPAALITSSPGVLATDGDHSNNVSHEILSVAHTTGQDTHQLRIVQPSGTPHAVNTGRVSLQQDDQAVLSSLPSSQRQNPSRFLDPDAIPFVSVATQEQSEDSQPRYKHDRRKNKAKTPLGTSKEDIDMEYAKAEIKTLKAKLKEQETSVKDLKFQNTILLDRISALEKPKKQSIFDTYFPRSESQEGPLTGGHTCHMRGCTRSQACASCHCIPATCSQPSNSPDLAAKLDTIEKSLSNLVNLVKLLETKKSTKEKPGTQSSPATNIAASQLSVPAPRIDASSVAEDSFISVDEEMPSISDEEHLN